MAKFRIEDITPPRKRAGNKRVIPEIGTDDDTEETHHAESRSAAPATPARKATTKHTPSKAAHARTHAHEEAPTVTPEEPPEEEVYVEKKIQTGTERFKSYFDEVHDEEVTPSEPTYLPKAKEEKPVEHYAYADDDRDPRRYDDGNKKGIDWGKWLPWLIGVTRC